MQLKKFWEVNKVILILLALLFVLLLYLLISYIPLYGHFLHVKANQLYYEYEPNPFEPLSRSSLYLYKIAYLTGDHRENIAYDIGLCYNKEKKFLEALRWFDKSISINPKYTKARYLKVKTLYWSGQFDEGEKEARLFTKRYPQNAEGWTFLALILYRKGSYREAAQYFEKAAQLEEELSYKESHLWSAAVSYEEVGDKPKADEILSRIISMKVGDWRKAKERINQPLSRRKPVRIDYDWEQVSPFPNSTHFLTFAIFIFIFSFLFSLEVLYLKRSLNFYQIIWLNFPLFLSVLLVALIDITLGLSPLFYILFMLPQAWLIFKGRGEKFAGEAFIISICSPLFFFFLKNGFRGLSPWFIWFERFHTYIGLKNKKSFFSELSIELIGREFPQVVGCAIFLFLTFFVFWSIAYFLQGGKGNEIAS